VLTRSFSSLTFVLALLSVAGLAACAAPPHPQVAKGSPPTPILNTPPPVMAVPPLFPAPPAEPSLADLGQGPQHFEGLEGKMVLAALGDPNFKRRETPAEVWQYYGPGCILDLFLYDDEPKDGDSKVAHAELRGRENAPAEAGCLSRLIGQRQNHHAASYSANQAN